MDGIKPDALNRALFDDSDDGLLIADADGRRIAVNDRCAAMSGYRPDDLLPLTPDNLIAPAPSGQTSPESRECAIRRHDGVMVPAESYFPGSSLDTTRGEGAHFLQKPFSRNDLAAKVREALAGGTHSS